MSWRGGADQVSVFSAGSPSLKATTPTLGAPAELTHLRSSRSVVRLVRVALSLFRSSTLCLGSKKKKGLTLMKARKIQKPKQAPGKPEAPSGGVDGP